MTLARQRKTVFAILAGSLTTTAFLVGPGPRFAFPAEVFTVPKSLALAVFALLSGAWLAASAVTASRERSGWCGGAATLALLALYFGVGLASWMTSGHAAWPLFDWLAHDGAAALLFVLARTRAARSSIPRLAALLSWVACALAVVALLEALGAPLAWSQIRRPVSLLGNRNLVGVYVAVAIPFALALAVARPSPARLLAVLLLFTVITLTRCRSAWMGLLAASLVATFVEIRRKADARPPPARVALAGAAAAFGILLSVATPWPGLRWKEAHPLASTAERLVAYGSGSGLVRVTQAKLAVAIANARPVGVGPGGWDDAESAFAAEVGDSLHEWQVTETPSSEGTRALAELGYPGLVVASALGLLVVGVAARRALRSRGPSWHPTLLAACVVALVHAALDAPFSRPPSIALFAVVAGLASTPTSRAARPARHRAAAWAFAAAAIALGVASAIAPTALFFAAVRTKRSASPWEKADAQRIYPRLYLAEYLTQRFGALGFCADAAEEAERLVGRVPHHLGPYHTVASCLEKKGDAAGAARWRGRADDLVPSNERGAGARTVAPD